MNEKAPPNARVAAASILLDRAYGKAPTFSTSDTQAFKRAIDMTDDELAAIVAKGRQASDPPGGIRGAENGIPMLEGGAPGGVHAKKSHCPDSKRDSENPKGRLFFSGVWLWDRRGQPIPTPTISWGLVLNLGTMGWSSWFIRAAPSSGVRALGISLEGT